MPDVIASGAVYLTQSVNHSPGLPFARRLNLDASLMPAWSDLGAAPLQRKLPSIQPCKTLSLGVQAHDADQGL